MKHIFSSLALCVLFGLSGVCVAQESSNPILVIDSGGHTSNVTDITFTSDGRQLISVGDDKVIRVWDVATGKTVRTIRGEIREGFEGRIFAVALSRDDKYLAVGGTFPGTGDERFAIRVYEFETGRLLKLLEGHKDSVLALAFSPDGQRLASGAGFVDKSVLIWDVARGRLVGSEPRPVRHEDRVTSIAFSPDGLWVASGSSDATVKLWDARTGRWAKDLTRHADSVLAVAFSPDGRWLVSGDSNKRIFLWNAKTGSFDKELGQMPDEIRNLTFSSGVAGKSSRLLVGAKGGHTAIISLPAGEIVPGYKHDGTVMAAALSPDGQVAATAGGLNNEIALWNPNDGTSRSKLVGGGRAVVSVGFARDGSSIAFGTQRVPGLPLPPLEQVIQLKQDNGEYRVTLGGPIKNEADYFRAITKHEDYELRLGGNAQIVIDKYLQVVKGNKLVANIERSQNAHLCYTFTHDGKYIVSGAEAGYLSLYERDTMQKVLDYSGHTNDVLSVAISSDDRYLVSGSSDQTIKIWDLRTGHNLLSVFVERGGEWAAWTPEGYYTSSFHGDSLIGWHLNRGVKETPQYFTAAQFRAAFNRPDVVGWLLVLRKIDLAVRQANASSGGQQSAYFDANIVRQSLPPTIEVLAPASKEMVSESPTLKLQARVLSRTLPITSVRVLLNGFSKGTFKGSPDDKEQGLRMEFEMAIGLEPGCNVLVIVAANENASSKPEIIYIGFGAQKEKCGGGETSSRRTFKVEPPRGALPDADESFFRSVDYDRPDNPAGSKGKNGARGVAARGAARRTFTSAPRPTVTVRPPDAPKINVVSPLETLKQVQNKNLTVTLELPKGVPSAVVQISRNGEEIHKITLTEGWSGEVVLKPGLNKVTIVATYADNTSDILERVITFEAPSDSRPRLIFLGIGIKTYDPTIRPPLQQLQFADNDAVELGKWVCRQGGENSTFAEVKSKVISNKEATRSGILAGLRWMNEQVRSDKDVRVLLISGHGIVKEDGEYYFYTSEQKGTEDPEELSIHWRIFWNKLGEKKSPTLFLVDTCRAGGVAPRNLVLEDKLDGIVFIASSNGNTPSVEFPELKHGVFTQKILEGLNGAAESTLRPDSLIDYRELAEWALEEVAKATHEGQVPIYKPAPGIRNFIVSTFPRPEVSAQIRCPEGVNQ